VREVWAQLWAAAASPQRFFRWLEPQSARIFRAGGVAFVSLAVLGFACVLGFARATGSDAYLPLAAFAVLGAGVALVYLWAFGSIFVQRPGALDVRAWEVVGWSWTPALFGSVAMLVPLWIFPVLALVAVLVTVLVWHLNVLWAGLGVFLNRPAITVVALYAAFILVSPLLLLGFLAWFSAQFT